VCATLFNPCAVYAAAQDTKNGPPEVYVRLKRACDYALAAEATQAHEQQQQHNLSIPAQQQQAATTVLPPTGDGEDELQLHALTHAALQQPLQQEHMHMEYHHHPNQQHSGRWLFELSTIKACN